MQRNSTIFSAQGGGGPVADRLSLTGEVSLEVELLTRTRGAATVSFPSPGRCIRSGETYIQGIIHDITNLKRIERALFRSKNCGYGTLLRTWLMSAQPADNINLSVEQLKPEMANEEANIYSISSPAIAGASTV